MDSRQLNKINKMIGHNHKVAEAMKITNKDNKLEIETKDEKRKGWKNEEESTTLWEMDQPKDEW